MTRTATTLLRCPKCVAAEWPDDPQTGPHATGLTNTRTIAGVRHSVAAMECGKCWYSWYSRTKRALKLAKAARKADRGAMADNPGAA